MKKVIFTLAVMAFCLLNGVAVYSVYASSFEPSIGGGVVTKKYQTQGYCTAWELGNMCTDKVTSEKCKNPCKD